MGRYEEGAEVLAEGNCKCLLLKSVQLLVRRLEDENNSRGATRMAATKPARPSDAVFASSNVSVSPRR